MVIMRLIFFMLLQVQFDHKEVKDRFAKKFENCVWKLLNVNVFLRSHRRKNQVIKKLHLQTWTFF